MIAETVVDTRDLLSDLLASLGISEPPPGEVTISGRDPIWGARYPIGEAVAVDPASGVVYQTEDREDGLLYRYVPNVPGRLLEGGRLQALVVAGSRSMDTRNWEGTAVRPGDLRR